MIRVAALQMVSGPEVQANLHEAGRLLDHAAGLGARLAALPENFALMGIREQDKIAVRERFGDGPIQSFLAETARRLGVWICAGSLPLEADDPAKVRNSCLVFDDSGQCAARYDKIHLFRIDLDGERHSEDRTIEAGNSVVTCASPFGTIGLSICYDIRFPELYRSMGPVDLILAPSAFTAATGKAHWETLLRARAIENLAYVLAPAQGGRHANGRETYGDSMIVDPWGVILNRLARCPGVVTADLDPQYHERVRASLPALEHRAIKCGGTGL
jgi:deaminated glutathione amidase